MYKDPLDRLVALPPLWEQKHQDYAAYLISECVVDLSNRLKISPFVVLRYVNADIRERISRGFLKNHGYYMEARNEN